MKSRFSTRLLGGFFIALLCSLPAAAQGVHYVGQVLKDSGRPAAGATIRVGTDAATGTPLTPLATIYTDQALSITAGTSADGTVIAAGVATADANGNFDFYAAGATEYTLQMSCSGCSTRTVHDILLPGSSSSSSFADNVFRVTDDGDATKKVAFQVSGVTTGNTRTLTVPDFDGTFATLAGVETLTNKKVQDSTTSIVDDGDATKVIKFQASGITTGTIRTMTAPDANGVWVVPFTCTGTDKLSAISATGVTTCSADAGGAGAGDNTTVNGSATTDDNFNDTLPAAPANSINVKWQLDTVAAPDNVSAYIPYAAPLTVVGGNLTSSHTTSSTDTYTNKTIDAEGSGNVITIPSKWWLPAAGANNATASPFWDLPTSNAAVASVITGSNTQKGVLDFADGANSLSAQNTFLLPSDWTGNIDAKFVWLASTNAGNVVWQIQTSCTNVDATETDDNAFNAAQTVTTTVPGTANRVTTSSIATLTTTGCTAGEVFHVKIFRDPAHASDTSAATARLIGVEFTVRRAM